MDYRVKPRVVWQGLPSNPKPKLGAKMMKKRQNNCNLVHTNNNISPESRTLLWWYLQWKRGQWLIRTWIHGDFSKIYRQRWIHGHVPQVGIQKDQQISWFSPLKTTVSSTTAINWLIGCRIPRARPMPFFLKSLQSWSQLLTSHGQQLHQKIAAADVESHEPDKGRTYIVCYTPFGVWNTLKTKKTLYTSTSQNSIAIWTKQKSAKSSPLSAKTSFQSAQ